MLRSWLLVVVCAGCGALHRGSPHGPRRAPAATDAALDPADDSRAFASLDQRLDGPTASFARPGNRVELLVDGRTSFEHRLESLREAEVVLVKTFAFTDDETGRAVAAALIERAKAGAHVIVQYDLVGSIHDPGDVAPMLANGNEKPIITRMREAGVEIVAANAPVGAVELGKVVGLLERTIDHPVDHLAIILDRVGRLEFHDHEKYWVTGRTVGGQLALTAIMGGMNIGSEYAFGGMDRVDAVTGARGWHDVDVEVTGPVVNDIVDRFFDVMEAQRGSAPDRAARARWNPAQPAAGTARVRFVYNHPRFGNSRAIEALYDVLIDAVPARGVVRIETAYFAPSSAIRQHLHAALARGTRLAVISNLDTNDTAPVAEGTWFVYHELLEDHPSAALYQRIARPDLGAVMVHCKVASFGTHGPIVVGSANLDGQSTEHNSEGVLVIEDTEVRARFDAMYATDYGPDRATRITLDALERDSTWRRLRQWAIWKLGWSWL